MAEIRKININGTTYNIVATSMSEANLTWGGKNFSGTYGPMDAALNPVLSPNRLAGMAASGILVEYSNDAGATWNTYSLTDTQKRQLVTTSQTIRVGGPTGNINAKAQVRVTLDGVNGGVYTQLNKWHIYVSTNYSNGCKVYVESYDYNSRTTWNKCLDWTSISGWSGWNVLNFTLPGSGAFGGTNDNQHQRKIRFTFKHDSISSGYEANGLCICKIYAYGGVGWIEPAGVASNGVPYTYDANGLDTHFAGKLYGQTIYENNTALSSLYLGIGAKSADADKLDGHDSTYFAVNGSATGGATPATDSQGSHSHNTTVPKLTIEDTVLVIASESVSSDSKGSHAHTVNNHTHTQK